MASDHRNAQPSDSASHQTTSSGVEQTLEPETSDRPRVANEQVDSATELTSLSTRVRIDGRGHAYGYGSMAREATTRSSDMSKNPIMGSSLNHGAELTKEGPPSYESVVKGRAPIIPENDDVVTTQPLSSSTVSQPAVDANLPAQSAPELDSITEQLIRDSQSESTECACCDRLSDFCDACGRCCTSQEMRCFCEVSWGNWF